MVEIAVQERTQAVFKSLQRETVSVSDKVIEERFIENINEIDKIPDVVRYIKDFSGDPSEFRSWKKSVERILKIYDSTRGTPRYFGILNVIRNKIIGNADVVLESYNTPLNWCAIVKCLTLHYADKSDINTLEFQLMSMKQGNNSLEQYYQNVYAHFSLILNKISCMEIDANAISLLNKTYRDKALDTFIRGLNGDLPRLLAVREPSDMPQALYLCQKIENQSLRSSQINNALKQQYKPQNNQLRSLSNQAEHYQQQRQPILYQQQLPFNRLSYPYPNIAHPYNQIPPPPKITPQFHTYLSIQPHHMQKRQRNFNIQNEEQ